jgi:hypothetical protein
MFGRYADMSGHIISHAKSTIFSGLISYHRLLGIADKLGFKLALCLSFIIVFSSSKGNQRRVFLSLLLTK